MQSQLRFPWEHESETLRVETPEQLHIDYRLATFSTRVLAALIDKLCIYGILVVIWIGLFIVGAPWIASESAYYLLAAALLAQFVLTIFYYVWAEMRSNGQSFGKRRMKLRTVLATGQGITLGASLIRNLARVVDEIPIFWIIPTLATGTRRIGDLLAGTYVIDETAPQKSASRFWFQSLAPTYRDLADRRFLFPSEVASRLYPDDLNLLEYLGDRLRDLAKQRQKQALLEIARQYVERLGLEIDRQRILDQPERFLQELGLFLKDRLDRSTF